MSQYYPTDNILKNKHLGRSITFEEYKEVEEAFHALGFSRGWVQNLDSHESFRPNFLKDKPFD